MNPNQHPILSLFLGAIGFLTWVLCIGFGIRNLKRLGYSPHWMWFALWYVPGALGVFIVSHFLLRKQQAEQAKQERTQRAERAPLQAENRSAAPEQAIRPPRSVPPDSPASPHDSAEKIMSERQIAEHLYGHGAKLIAAGSQAGSKELIADGLEKLQESIGYDPFYMEPWILTLKTLYRAFGRGRLEEMLSTQVMFTAPGEPEKTRILREILDHLDETGSFPSFAEPNLEGDDQRPKPAAVEMLRVATTLFKSGEKDKSDELLLRAVELDPDYVEARIALAYACVERGEHDEAISNARHAVRLDPGYADARDALFEAYACKGRRHLDLRELKDAFDCFNSALLANPDHPNAEHAFNDLCMSLTEASARGEFIEVCKRLLTLRPERNYVRSKLGLVLVRYGRSSEGLPVLIECVRRDQFDVEALQWLSIAYCENRMIEKGKEQYELLKRIDSEKAASVLPIIQRFEDDRRASGDDGDHLFGKN